MSVYLTSSPFTIAKLKKDIPTVLEVFDCNSSPNIPVGVLIIFVDGPELNDLIQEILPVGICAEIITWSFQPNGL